MFWSPPYGTRGRLNAGPSSLCWPSTGWSIASGRTSPHCHHAGPGPDFEPQEPHHRAQRVGHLVGPRPGEPAGRLVAEQPHQVPDPPVAEQAEPDRRRPDPAQHVGPGLRGLRLRHPDAQLRDEQLVHARRRRVGRDAAVPPAQQLQALPGVAVRRVEAEHDLAQLLPRLRPLIQLQPLAVGDGPAGFLLRQLLADDGGAVRVEEVGAEEGVAAGSRVVVRGRHEPLRRVRDERHPLERQQPPPPTRPPARRPVRGPARCARGGPAAGRRAASRSCPRRRRRRRSAAAPASRRTPGGTSRSPAPAARRAAPAPAAGRATSPAATRRPTAPRPPARSPAPGGDEYVLDRVRPALDADHLADRLADR